ncbi:MAG TPA: trypsin-like peptidase domain-containing protein [Frankiaceae bacterium]|nr:trypsin-like peptidase domain-containing protein [Frankiaceae bacterium]
MNENPNGAQPDPAAAGTQRLRWDQHGRPYGPPQYGPQQNGASQYEAPQYQYGPPQHGAGQQFPYGPPAGPPLPPYGHGTGYGTGFGPVPPPRRRSRVPAVMAGSLAAVVAAGALLVQGGAVQSLAGGSSATGTGSGTSSTGTATSNTSPDYDAGVVNINTILGGQNAAAAGTGMILNADGTVLTNNHVVDGATSITATDVNTGKEYSASVVGTDAKDDIAVIRLRNASGLTPVSIGDSASLAVGQKVVAIGNAGGKGGTPSVVTGSITALGQTITATDSNGGNAETLHNLIQVDAPIVAGDSGGPLTDTSGKVIGINTAASGSQAAQFDFGSGSGSSDSPGFGSGGFGSNGSGGNGSGSNEGFAIPISTALTIAKQIESGQSDPSSSTSTNNHGYLGVQVTDGSSAGAAVAGTVVGSPAEAAGLASGDVIVAVNGTRVSSAADLSQLLANTTAGQQVSLSWTDSSGQESSATVTLMSGSASQGG